MLELAIATVVLFGGCCSNVYSLELIIKESRKSGNLITFVQFLFVATEGLLNNLEWTRKDEKTQKKHLRLLPTLKQRHIPLHRWCVMVLLFFFTSVLNNHALGYRIPMPLHIIFRSSSLVVSMLMGYVMNKKSYSWGQILGVFLVTLGVLQTTLASTNSDTSQNDPTFDSYYEWSMGIATLVLAVIIACFMGQYQQMTYSKYGSHWREGLFYTHFLGLPGFALFYQDIKNQVTQYNQSNTFMWPKSALLEPLASVHIPSLWVFLTLNTLTQYICISSVYKISSMASSVTLNLFLSIRKFISLLISIYMFGNEFTAAHWSGTAAVFVGTMIYTISPNDTSDTTKKKTE